VSQQYLPTISNLKNPPGRDIMVNRSDMMLRRKTKETRFLAPLKVCNPSSGQKLGFWVPMRNIKPGGIGIGITHSQDTARCWVYKYYVFLFTVPMES
jgi:hypothetical protein